jgi:hypothetical protein
MSTVLLNIILADAQNPPSLRGFGPIGLSSGENPLTVFEKVITVIVGFLTIAAILWFALQIIIGGFGWISAGGDPKAAENARKRITNAVIGIIVVIMALTLVRLVGSLLGIPDILKIEQLLIKIRG